MLVRAIPPEVAELLCKPGWEPQDANSGGLWVLRGALGAVGAHAGAGHPPARPLGALTTTHLTVMLPVGAQYQHLMLLLVPVPGAFCRKTLPQRCAEGWIPSLAFAGG